MVEVVFTVSPRVRRIAAHDPHTMPFWDYYRQVSGAPVSTCPTRVCNS
jgi:hypothetical protein